MISSSTPRTRTRTTGSAATTVCPARWSASRRPSSRQPPSASAALACRYYADSTSSVSVAAFTAGVLLDVLDTESLLAGGTSRADEGRPRVRPLRALERRMGRVAAGRLCPHRAAQLAHCPYFTSRRLQPQHAGQWLAARSDSLHPSAPSVVLPSFSSSSSSSSAVLKRSLIHVAAVDQHLAAICPNRPK